MMINRCATLIIRDSRHWGSSKNTSIDTIDVNNIDVYYVFQYITFEEALTMPNIFQWYMEMDMAAFAERLRLLRQARNLSQSRLAELLGINPPLGTPQRACAALGHTN